MTPKPKPANHLRRPDRENSAICGMGSGIRRAAIVDDPAEVTCRNCLKVHRAIQIRASLAAKGVSARFAGPLHELVLSLDAAEKLCALLDAKAEG